MGQREQSRTGHPAAGRGLGRRTNRRAIYGAAPPPPTNPATPHSAAVSNPFPSQSEESFTPGRTKK